MAGSGSTNFRRWGITLAPSHAEHAAVLGAVKARPGGVGVCGKVRATAGLDRACARRRGGAQVGTKG